MGKNAPCKLSYIELLSVTYYKLYNVKNIILLCLACACNHYACPKSKFSDMNCPSGWYIFEGQCYKLTYTAETRSHCARTCNDEDAYLVSITSEKENDFVANL